MPILQKYADQGIAEGQISFGHCLEYGTGILIDFVVACPSYKTSADQGDAGGQICYGYFLESGKGILIDLVAARRSMKSLQIKAMLLTSNAIASFGILFHRSLRVKATIQVLTNGSA
jgi:TPR repeat protein